MAPVLRIVAILTVVFGLSACFFREDYGTDGMTIRNETLGPVEVIYRRPMGPTNAMFEDPVVEVGSNQEMTVIGLHQTEGPCLRGTLIAIQDGREIATLSQPCEGTDWVITLQDG